MSIEEYTTITWSANRMIFNYEIEQKKEEIRRAVEAHGVRMYFAGEYTANDNDDDDYNDDDYYDDDEDEDYSNADFSNENLSNSVFNGDFEIANFNQVNLSNSVFNGDFETVNFIGATFNNCNFVDTDFEKINFIGVNFDSTELNADEVNNSHDNFLPSLALFCPNQGAFTAYKKATKTIIIVLEIPDDAKRSSGTSFMCRTNKAKVVSIENLDGTTAGLNAFKSDYDDNFVYKIGETISIDFWEENRWIESSNAIHFFLTREMAVVYDKK